MFEELFRRRTFNVKKALLFGFQETDGVCSYETDILDHLFRLRITITSSGKVDTDLTENETGEPYILYKTNSVGFYVSEIRTAIGAVLAEAAEKCFDFEIFTSPQTKEIIQYVREKYGDELEYLWKKFPDNAIWRRRDTEKWYGAVLTVAGTKLGLPTGDILEIIDLRVPPEKMSTLLAKGNYYPGWHMNKKYWCTIILDGSVTTEEICRQIDESYELALR